MSMDEVVASTSSSTISLKRSRDQQQQDPWESPEAKRFREDLLFDILDGDDEEEAGADLADVMHSFEEEIAASVSPLSAGSSASSSYDDYPEPDVQQQAQQLGFLLEASDDELGLPPAVPEEEQQQQPVVTNEGDVSPDGLQDTAAANNYWGLRDQDAVFTLPIVGSEEERWHDSAAMLDAMATLDDAFADDFSDAYLSWPSDLPDFSLVA